MRLLAIHITYIENSSSWWNANIVVIFKYTPSVKLSKRYLDVVSTYFGHYWRQMDVKTTKITFKSRCLITENTNTTSLQENEILRNNARKLQKAQNWLVFNFTPYTKMPNTKRQNFFFTEFDNTIQKTVKQQNHYHEESTIPSSYNPGQI